MQVGYFKPGVEYHYREKRERIENNYIRNDNQGPDPEIVQSLRFDRGGGNKDIKKKEP